MRKQSTASSSRPPSLTPSLKSLFRKRLSFSVPPGLVKILTSTGPTLARAAPIDEELSATQKDVLFRYQLSSYTPKVLGADAYYVAGVVSHLPMSRRVRATLMQTSILSPHPSDPTVYTHRITRSFSHQFSFLGPCSQRQLVALLFFWEEELVRWSGLERDALDVNIALKELEGDGQDDASETGERDCGKGKVAAVDDRRTDEVIKKLKVARNKVEAERKMLPSLRRPAQGQEAKPAVPPGRFDTLLEYDALLQYGQPGTAGMGVMGGARMGSAIF